MTIQRKLLILTLALLLLSVGIVSAQTSANFVTQRFVMIGGDSAGSANYEVTSVFGQPAVQVVESPNYSVSAGFLQPRRLDLDPSVWLPVVVRQIGTRDQ